MVTQLKYNVPTQEQLTAQEDWLKMILWGRKDRNIEVCVCVLGGGAKQH